MLVSCVHPVAILRSVFCIICSLSMLVSDALGGSILLLLLFAFQSMFISIWVSRLEIAEFPDSVRRSAP